MQTSANISLHRSAAIIHLYLPRGPLPGDRLAVDEVRCVRGGEFITPNAAPPPRVRVLVALGVCCRWRSGESRVERGADWQRSRLARSFRFPRPQNMPGKRDTSKCASQTRFLTHPPHISDVDDVPFSTDTPPQQQVRRRRRLRRPLPSTEARSIGHRGCSLKICVKKKYLVLLAKILGYFYCGGPGGAAHLRRP